MNFGWIPPHKLTHEQQAAHAAIVASLPKFKIVGQRSSVQKVALWDCSKAVNNGKHFATLYQQTGSCVSHGGGNAIWYLEAVDVARLGKPETPTLPFFLLPYGRSRVYAGMHGRGEGSSGAAFVKAVLTDGIVSSDTPGLPQWQDVGGVTWGKSVEMEWSDGDSISQKWLELSRKHLVKTVSRIHSADEAREALCNYYPLTLASDWGGLMKPPAQGSPAVLLNQHADTWEHQMSSEAWWDHPQLGEIFFILNSWGYNAHGAPPDDSVPGGFWIKKADMDYICKTGEVFAFSQFDGFPAQEIDPSMFKLLGK